jgi:hypothetical protein
MLSVTGPNRLSPQVLAEIVNRFGDRPEAAAGGYARFPLRHCIGLAQIKHEHSAFEAVPVEVVDLAVRGLGFKMCTPVATGSRLSIELKVPGLLLQTWHCRVVRVHALDGKHYYVGATFEQVSHG